MTIDPQKVLYLYIPIRNHKCESVLPKLECWLTRIVTAIVSRALSPSVHDNCSTSFTVSPEHTWNDNDNYCCGQAEAAKWSKFVIGQRTSRDRSLCFPDARGFNVRFMTEWSENLLGDVCVLFTCEHMLPFDDAYNLCDPNYVAWCGWLSSAPAKCFPAELAGNWMEHIVSCASHQVWCNTTTRRTTTHISFSLSGMKPV